MAEGYFKSEYVIQSSLSYFFPPSRTFRNLAKLKDFCQSELFFCKVFLLNGIRMKVFKKNHLIPKGNHRNSDERKLFLLHFPFENKSEFSTWVVLYK